MLELVEEVEGRGWKVGPALLRNGGAYLRGEVEMLSR
jgi:hypothetical protein